MPVPTISRRLACETWAAKQMAAERTGIIVASISAVVSRWKKPREQTGSFWIAELVLLVGAWACYTVRLTTSELILGLASVSLSVWLTHLVWTLRPLQALIRWDLLGKGWPIPWYLITGTGDLVIAGLAQIFTRRGADSLIRSVPFEVGSDDRASRTRRILAVSLTTSTPNCIVLGIVKKQRLLVYHQIKSREVLPMTKRLGAKA